MTKLVLITVLILLTCSCGITIFNPPHAKPYEVHIESIDTDSGTVYVPMVGTEHLRLYPAQSVFTELIFGEVVDSSTLQLRAGNLPGFQGLSVNNVDWFIPDSTYPDNSFGCRVTLNASAVGYSGPVYLELYLEDLAGNVLIFPYSR